MNTAFKNYWNCGKCFYRSYDPATKRYYCRFRGDFVRRDQGGCGHFKM